MALVIAIAIVGAAIAAILCVAVYVVVTRAVDNVVRWAILNFGNEDAVEKLRELPPERDDPPPGA